ncbi:MAG: carbohydrate ABC transporter permease [Oscillospiraceae bacterium]|nr:carbohydrate ABC transporter permease [Oscillospiraceae bacterium]
MASLTKNKNVKIKDTFGDKVLNWFTGFFLIFVIAIVAYPLMFVISASFSSSKALEAGKVFMFPVDPTLYAYQFVLGYEPVWTGFRNTIFYCAWGVFLDTFLTLLVAYPLSRPNFAGKRAYTMVFYLSTRIGAGLIPGFLLRVDLGMYDTLWPILFPGAVAVGNILVLRTAIKSGIPGELFDAAMIDGASHFQCMITLVLPLAKATLSVLVLYSLVGHWNEYFNAMIYLSNKELYPLQLVLRPVMTAGAGSQGINAAESATSSQAQKDEGLEHVRYALIVITTAPIIVAYSFVEKYFEKGMMMGSVKG